MNKKDSINFQRSSDLVLESIMHDLNPIYRETVYHSLILRSFLNTIDSTIELKSVPLIFAEIPTGCGKSLILLIIAEYIRRKYKYNVLIVTHNYYLARFAAETYGKRVQLSCNRIYDSYIPIEKLL